MLLFGKVLLTWFIAMVVSYFAIYPETRLAKFLTKLHGDEYDAVLRSFGYLFFVSLMVIVLIEVWIGF